MREHTRTFPRLALALAGTAAAMGLWSAPAQGAGALWISAPNWSYSAAAAESPLGFAYFWGLSVGPGTYSFAYAFSNDGAGDAAFAMAEASAGGLGGQCAVQVAGLADPFAGVGVDYSLSDPSNPSGYPTSKPGSDPFTSAYTASPAGIVFPSGDSSSEMNGADAVQAFVYDGSTADSTLRSDLGASSDGGTTLAGDVTDIPTLTTDLGLIPLDPLITDPASLDPSGIVFTENQGDVDANGDNVILVAMSDAQSPEPASLSLLSMGGLAVLRRRRRMA